MFRCDLGIFSVTLTKCFHTSYVPISTPAEKNHLYVKREVAPKIQNLMRKKLKSLKIYNTKSILSKESKHDQIKSFSI